MADTDEDEHVARADVGGTVAWWYFLINIMEEFNLSSCELNDEELESHTLPEPLASNAGFTVVNKINHGGLTRGAKNHCALWFRKPPDKNTELRKGQCVGFVNKVKAQNIKGNDFTLEKYL